MFVPFKRPHKGEFIRLYTDITNQRGTFVAPHDFECTASNDEVCSLRDRNGNTVTGVINADIRDHFKVIARSDYEQTTAYQTFS